jgi:hypothetical protein
LYAKDFGGTQVVSSNFSGTTYTQVSITFTTGPSNTTATVGIWRDSGSGYMFSDDYELFSASASPTAKPAPTNLPTKTQSPTNTPTRTMTPTNTPTKTSTPTNTLTRTPTPTNTPAPVNLLSNSGFASGVLGPWGVTTCVLKQRELVSCQRLHAQYSLYFPGLAEGRLIWPKSYLYAKDFGGAQVVSTSFSGTIYTQISITLTRLLQHLDN